jgi:hypothetical protein
MVERVARAIEDANLKASGDEDYTPLARAAIEAMREPTEAMLKAGFHKNRWTNPKPCHDHCVGRVTLSIDEPWRAMIDAALSEQEQG